MFWSQHLGCWGQNTSRIQNKTVYATLRLTYHTGTSAIRVEASSHVYFERVDLSQLGANGFTIGANTHDLLIQSCSITSIGGEGVAFESATNVTDVMLNGNLLNDTAHVILGQSGTHMNQNGAKTLDLRCVYYYYEKQGCYRIPAPIGAGGSNQNTSRIQKKEVETTFHV